MLEPSLYYTHTILLLCSAYTPIVLRLNSYCTHSVQWMVRSAVYLKCP